MANGNNNKKKKKRRFVKFSKVEIQEMRERMSGSSTEKENNDFPAAKKKKKRDFGKDLARAAEKTQRALSATQTLVSTVSDIQRKRTAVKLARAQARTAGIRGAIELEKLRSARDKRSRARQREFERLRKIRKKRKPKKTARSALRPITFFGNSNPATGPVGRIRR